MSSHEHEVQLLSDKMDNDRQRQLVTLRERMADRRKRRMDNLHRKHEVELTKEMLAQKKEVDEIRSTKVMDAAYFMIKTDDVKLIETLEMDDGKFFLQTLDIGFDRTRISAMMPDEGRMIP